MAEFEREVREIAARVSALRAQGVCPVIIGIDGMALSGKTALAELLAQTLDASVVHTGDFILPQGFRTPVRMNTPGGNFHRERFAEEVLPYLRSGALFGYRIYDFHSRGYEGTRLVAPKEVIIVEGAYALHPDFGDIYDLRIFCKIDGYAQLERINAACGALADLTRGLWVPQENYYHKTFGIEESCHMVITTGAPRESVPLEIERKYLIRMPDLTDLATRAVRIIKMEQVYLKSAVPGVSARIRRSEENGVTVYHKNEKQPVNAMVRIEREEEITETDWNILVGFADSARVPIRKTRYCVPMGELTLEVDIFPFWADRALCEVELPHKDTPVTLPDWVDVVREVTWDRRYTNLALALRIPLEEL